MVEAFVVCVVMEIMDSWWVPLARFEAMCQFVGVACYKWGEMRMEIVEARRGAYGNFPYNLHSKIRVSQ